MSFGSVPTNSSSIPLGSVYTPNTANSDLTALEGGPISTDGNSQKSAPASMYVKDGANVTQGISTDGNTANTVMGRLTKIRDVLLAGVAVTGTFWQSVQPVSGTFWQATQPVSAATLPLPTGASTAAKQPALGTAGSASSDVLSVQGITSMTPLKTDNSGVTQPVQQSDLTVSGTINAAQPLIGTLVSNAVLVLAVGQGQASWEAQLVPGGGGFTSASTIVVDTSIDNDTTWFTSGFKVSGSLTSTTVQSVVGTGNNIKLVGNASVKSHIRIRCSILGSGESVAVTIRSGAGTGDVGLLSSVPTGTNSIGSVTANAGTNLNTSTLALEAGGNLATLVTNTADLLADGDHLATIDTSTAASKTDLDTIVTNTNKIPASPAQEAGNLATLVTNTADLLADGDHLATIDSGIASLVTNTADLLADGDNLATIATNTTGLATDAHATTTATNTTTIAGAITSAKVQANIAQINGQTPTLDNTTIQAVSIRGKGAGTAGDTAVKLNSSGDLYVISDFSEQASLSAGSLNADLVPSTDMSGYETWSLQVTAIASGATITFQGSNDGSAFISILGYNANGSGAPVSTTTGTGIFYGPRNYRYFRARQTAWTSGSTTGVFEAYTLPTYAITQSINAAQNGTWTVQPGNTANTTAWKVDGSAVTQPVSGTVTANAGTNLNTSTLALEAGGNLATIQTNTANIPAKGAAATSASTPVNIASDQIVPTKTANWTNIYTTTQTGVSSWAGTGDLSVSQYSQLLINIQLSAISGTSIQFITKRKDSFGNYYAIDSPVALTSASGQNRSIGPGVTANAFFGATAQLVVTLVAITSVTFTIDIWAR